MKYIVGPTIQNASKKIQFVMHFGLCEFSGHQIENSDYDSFSILNDVVPTRREEEEDI